MLIIEFILNRFGNIDYSEQYKKIQKKTFTKILKSHKFKNLKSKKCSLFIFLSSVNGKLALKLNKKFTDIFKGNTGLLRVEIQKMSNELSIILPTLNEGKNLEKLIPQIFEILAKKC